jgi:hypothetical protein
VAATSRRAALSRALQRSGVGSTVVPAGAGTRPTAAAAAVRAPADGPPLVLDTDLRPNVACKRPVHARISLYYPQGVSAHRAVEWRMRFGDRTVRTGTVTMDTSVVATEITIPYAEVPAATSVQVDARTAGGGDFGAVWREDLGRGCDPVHVVSAGDSVVWNQGVDHDQKFTRLVAKELGGATGRRYQHDDYSISGAVLDAPELPAARDGRAAGDDRSCLDERYPQDPDGDGEMELGEVTAQMPDVFCQLEKAGAEARAGGHGVDLVILNGCVNDLDPFFGVPLGITPGVQDLPAAVTRECAGIGALPDNPAKDVPYFSGAKVGYGGRGMREAVEKAHALPGHPKVVVANFLYPFTVASVPVLRDFCTKRDLPADLQARCQAGLGQAAGRYELYTRLVADAYRQAADQANAASTDGAYAVAADGLFTLDQSVLAPDAKVWSNPTTDQAYPLRRNACPEFSPTPPQCLTAAVGHPDVAGSAQYAANILLNPRLRSWFGLPAGLPVAKATVTVSTTAGTPGTEVSLRTTARAGAGTRYQWYFGDGTTQTTDTAATTHRYDAVGPSLPRVVTVDGDGDRDLREARRPVVIG